MFKKVFTPSICNIAKDISGELLFISRFLYVDFFFFFSPARNKLRPQTKERRAAQIGFLSLKAAHKGVNKWFQQGGGGSVGENEKGKLIGHCNCNSPCSQ